MSNIDLAAIRCARPDELAQAVAIDDDSSLLYAAFGIAFELSADHPFVRAESARWEAAVSSGRMWFAVDASDRPLGFIACGELDATPYLDQISVRRAHMRRGIGRRLLEHAIRWAGERPLWLTTYAHLPWNRPYYERAGFVVVPEAQCGPALRAALAEQRKALPAPQDASRCAASRYQRTKLLALDDACALSII